jgi:hypothetical protein
VDQKYYLWQEEEDGLVHPVLDSLDNYKMLRVKERANYLSSQSEITTTILASDLRKVKTAFFVQDIT